MAKWRKGNEEKQDAGRRRFVDMFSRALSTLSLLGPLLSMAPSECPLGLYIQPACLQHRYIRHTNASHIFERPERLRAVLLGVAAAVAGLEQRNTADDLAGLLSSLSLVSPAKPTAHLHLVPAPPLPPTPGTILLHHPAVQLAHSPVPDAPFPYIGPPSTGSSGAGFPSSSYLRDLVKWANGAVDRIKQTGCEIPEGLGLNPGDLYLGPGSIVAIEGAVSWSFSCRNIWKIYPVIEGPDAELDPNSLSSGRSCSAETKTGIDQRRGAVYTPCGGSCRCAIVHESVLCDKTTRSSLW